MPFGHRCWACSAARPVVVVGWRSGDVAATQRRRPVGRNPTGTGVLVHAGSWTPWRRVCTRLAEVHRANVAHHEWAATSLGRTCVCRWPHELRRSALVATCRSSPLARLPGWHWSWTSRKSNCNGAWGWEHGVRPWECWESQPTNGRRVCLELSTWPRAGRIL